VQSLKVVDIPSSVSENGFLEHYWAQQHIEMFSLNLVHILC
jgi:hypothetical protein